MGQYYSIRAVSSDGKIKKQNEPKKRMGKKQRCCYNLIEKVLLLIRKTFWLSVTKLSNSWKSGLISLDNYYLYEIKLLSLKSKPTYSDCKEAVVVLNLKTSFNLDESYEEFYIILYKIDTCIASEQQMKENSFWQQTVNFQMLHD
jgi:hypothetical protein